uniref:Uncharacterized protein n=1 Tax=Timema genevievae TaxID=629358 RepID=A0A7R9K4N8_TIMGE|nr:unnamed protein product [Timema genevievae]
MAVICPGVIVTMTVVNDRMEAMFVCHVLDGPYVTAGFLQGVLSHHLVTVPGFLLVVRVPRVVVGHLVAELVLWGRRVGKEYRWLASRSNLTSRSPSRAPSAFPNLLLSPDVYLVPVSRIRGQREFIPRSNRYMILPYIETPLTKYDLGQPFSDKPRSPVADIYQGAYVTPFPIMPCDALQNKLDSVSLSTQFIVRGGAGGPLGDAIPQHSTIGRRIGWLVTVVEAEGSSCFLGNLRTNTKHCSSLVATGSGTISHYFNLHVVVPSAFILGSGEYHIGEGSTISLVCIIENYRPPWLACQTSR